MSIHALPEDTIAAIATAPGMGAIGVVRISGDQALRIAEKVFVPSSLRSGFQKHQYSSHSVVHGHVVDPDDQTRVDEVLLLLMRAPRSYTGEDVVELQGHGGPVTLAAVLRAVLRAGARSAEPGEFTRRAFLHQRMDLSQAEAVADLINARSQKGARLALEQLQGRLGDDIHQLRERILDVMAQLEVVLDYPEMSIEDQDRLQLFAVLQSMYGDLQRLLDSASAGRAFRDGVRTVILGRPNVGKSSLLNALLGRERAIVTDVPGTTRDLLEESVIVNGLPLILVDTAGIRDSEDVVEQIGVDRATQASEEADLILMIVDDSEPLSTDDLVLMERLQGTGRLIVVVNKVDLAVGALRDPLPEDMPTNVPVVRLSALTREGLEELADTIARLILGREDLLTGEESSVVTNARHEEALRRAQQSLKEAGESLEDQLPADIISIDLRDALEALGLITGESVTEDLLDRIFSTFCLGK